MKLKICNGAISNSTFKYLATPQKHINYLEIHDETQSQNIQLQFSSVSDSTIEVFSSRFTSFGSFEENAKFIKYAI